MGDLPGVNVKSFEKIVSDFFELQKPKL